MPRRPNTRPTNIYWLFDVRPETIAVAPWSAGKPFYCGKTVVAPEKRLRGHRYVAVSKPHGDVGPRIIECGEFIRVQTMEIVPFDQDWYAREKFWIATGRLLYPGCFLNISDGGQGVAGYIPSAETRAKMSARLRGKKHSPEHRAKIGAAKRGKKRSAETCAKIKAAKQGTRFSAEHIARTAAGNKGRKNSPEHRAKISAASKEMWKSSEHVAHMSAAMRGKKHSPETRARLSVSSRDIWKSPEYRAKTSAAMRGKIFSPEHRAKMSEAQKRRYARERNELAPTSNAT